MKINKTAIVTTTINVPTFLNSYFVNFENHGVKPEEVVFIIVGDNKTPPEARDYAERFKKYPVEYWDVVKQKKWIKKNYDDVERVDFAIPYNSVRRRNFGYLRALELGADAIITIDDDNYAGSSTASANWLKEHLDSFTEKHRTISSQNMIVNPCNMLQFNHSKIYSRGYPPSRMFSDTFDDIKAVSKPVVLNMGLWTESPDVDAFTNIQYPNLRSYGFNRLQTKYSLAPFIYMPVNTQNTAFLRKVTPAFYCLLMDTELYGTRLDRYDDIWSGFFALRLAHQFGETATFGTPLTRHSRNKHDFIGDLKSELNGILLNSLMFETVKLILLASDNYRDGYMELANALDLAFDNMKVAKDVVSYVHKMTKAMKIWVTLTDRWLK